MGMGYNKSKFIFSETFNNKDGKTSGSGFIGVLLGLTAVLMAVAGTFGYFFGIGNTMEFLGIVMKIITASGLLLGVRKIGGQIVEAKKGKDDTEDPTSVPLFEQNPNSVDTEKG